MIKYNYDSTNLNAIIICCKVAYYKQFIEDIKKPTPNQLEQAKTLKSEMNKWFANVENSEIKIQIDWDNCWNFLNTIIYNYNKWR